MELIISDRQTGRQKQIYISTISQLKVYLAQYPVVRYGFWVLDGDREFSWDAEENKATRI